MNGSRIVGAYHIPNEKDQRLSDDLAGTGYVTILLWLRNIHTSGHILLVFSPNLVVTPSVISMCGTVYQYAKYPRLIITASCSVASFWAKS